MRKQLYKIDKYDWLASVRRGKKTQYVYAKDRQDLEMTLADRCEFPGAQIQIFKLSHEFRDAYVVTDPRAVKAKMKKK